MTLIDQRPSDLPTTDTLANIPADLLGPIPAEIRLGANVLMMMPTPPDVGDVITVTMRLKVKRKAEDEAGDGGEDRIHFRACKIVAAWLKGEPEPPNVEDEQPALINTDGEIEDDAADDNVLRPGFSDGGAE
jgi:hypothetical protein